MALTELQRPTKEVFYRTLQHMATRMDTVMDDWRDLAGFLANVSTTDMDDMTIPAGQVRTDMTAFRTALEEVIAFYDGTSTTQTDAPADVIAKIRLMT